MANISVKATVNFVETNTTTENSSGNGNTVVPTAEHEITTSDSKRKQSQETEFEHFLQDAAYCAHPVPRLNKILPNLKIHGFQIPLFSAEAVLTRGAERPKKWFFTKTPIGRIDVLMTYKNRTYVAEIKDYNPGAESFWYATKAAAYCEYYKWQTDKKGYHPAVIIPKESIRLEHQVVAGRLGIKIFLFKKDINGEFKMKLLNEKPHWKQDDF